jgi:hypothetical protein
MPASNNRLLASLSTSDFDLLGPRLESVTLRVRKYLERPNRRIEAAYFPEGGFASVVAVQSNGKQVEVGLIGREGMTGLPIVLGNHRSPHATYVQAPGKGACIPAAELSKAIRTSVSLRDSLLKFRAGVRRANNPHRHLQRAVQARRQTGALAVDGARSDRRGHASAYPRVFGAHARRAAAWRDRSSAHITRSRIDFVWAGANRGEGPQAIGARGRRSLWRSRVRISPPDPVKRRRSWRQPGCFKTRVVRGRRAPPARCARSA